MRLCFIIILAVLLIQCPRSCICSMRQDQADQISWYKKNIGTPVSFDAISHVDNLFFVTSAKNVIAAFNSSSFKIEWRHFVSAGQVLFSGVVGTAVYTIVQGPGTFVLDLYDAVSGFHRLENPIEKLEKVVSTGSAGSWLYISSNSAVCGYRIDSNCDIVDSKCAKTGALVLLNSETDTMLAVRDSSKLVQLEGGVFGDSSVAVKPKIDWRYACVGRNAVFYLASSTLHVLNKHGSASLDLRGLSVKKLLACSKQNSVLLQSDRGVHLLSAFSSKFDKYTQLDLEAFDAILKANVESTIELGAPSAVFVHEGSSIKVSIVTVDGSWHIYDTVTKQLVSRFESLTLLKGHTLNVLLPVSKQSVLPSNLVERFGVSGWFKTGEKSVSEGSFVYGDNFGFNQLVVALLDRSTGGEYSVVAVYTSTGNIAWKRFVPCNADITGGVFLLHNELMSEQRVGLVCDSTLLLIDALTGRIESRERVEPQLSQLVIGQQTFGVLKSSQTGADLSLLSAKSTTSSSVVPVLESTVFVSLSPDKKSISAFEVNADKRLKLLWDWRLVRSGEEFIKVESNDCGKVTANTGIVQDDRTVFYNLLDTQYVVVFRTFEGHLYPSIVDAATGNVHYETFFRVPNAGTAQAVVCENWAAVYFEAAPKARAEKATVLRNGTDIVEPPVQIRVAKRSKKGGAAGVQNQTTAESNYRGPQILFLQWFESNIPDQKSSSVDSFFGKVPYVRPALYSLPNRVHSLSVTKTRHGITTRQLILYTDSGQLHTITMPALGWTHPLPDLTLVNAKVASLPLSSPVLPSLLSLVAPETLSHRHRLLGISSLQSIPTHLESTCVVVAAGLDWFKVDASPSRQFDMLAQDFSKVGLFGTVFCLLFLIKVMQRLVYKRSLEVSWS